MTSPQITGQVFGKSYGGNAAENYEKFFVPVIGGPLAADLIESAALKPGERVLDVACGTGVVTRLAAERVGPSGTVSGLDVNPGMLAVARSLTSGKTIRWYETSAEATALSDESFDVVLCQLGLMFVPDKPAALREMRRVLATGGRVLITLPGPTEFWGVFERAIEKHVGAQAGGIVRIIFSMHDANEMSQLLTDAGFREVRVDSRKKVLELPAAEVFMWQYIESTPLAAIVGTIDDTRRAALEREVVSGWQKWRRDDRGGMSYEQPVMLARALK